MFNTADNRSNREKTAELLVCDVKKDLHIHTYYSDGRLSPEEVVDRWHSNGYKLIAITDHDGIEGSMVGEDYARGVGIDFIRGIEFDSEDAMGKDLHILGYGMDFGNPRLQTVLFDIILKRARRNDALMAALNEMGYEITLDDVGAVNDGRFIGKPTFATILKEKGYIEDFQEAFEKIFRHESIKRVVKETLSTKEVIDVIHEADGIAVMAHPMEQRHRSESFEEFLPRLTSILDTMVSYGIDGIECFHPSASEMQSELLEKYANEHGLLITRGSDFHADDINRDFSRYHRD